MSIFERTKAVLPVLLAAVILTLLGNSVQAAVISCNSCGGCNSQIQAAAAGDTIQLTSSISNAWVTCIDFAGKDNLIFDCLGNSITGNTGWGASGILLGSAGGSNNNSIRNCDVRNYYYGISVTTSSNNSFINMTVNSTRYGITISRGQGNVLANITFIRPSGAYVAYDVYVYASADSECNNILSNVTGSSGRPIKYFNSSVTLSNQVLSELILCNADNSNLNNVTVVGSQAIGGENAIYLIRTDNSRLANINSTYDTGLYMESSSNNDIANSTFNWGGVMLVSSSNNVFFNVTISSTGTAFTISSGSNNTLTSINANNNWAYGIFLNLTTNNTLSNIIATNNAYYDIYIVASSDSQCNHNLTNVIGTGWLPVAYFNGSVTLSNQVLSELILCNADGSEIRNITIKGSSGKNNGVLVLRTDNSLFTDINSSYKYYGLYMQSSSSNTFANVTASYNSQSGFWMISSSQNMITNVTAVENTNYDIYLLTISDQECTNMITNAIGSNNYPIMYFNSSTTLSDKILSELILCNADYSNVTNVTIMGSVSKKNNGILISLTDYSNLTNINSSYRNIGLIVRHGTDDIFTNITASLNYGYGIYVSLCSRTTFTNVNASSNKGGPYTASDGMNIANSPNTWLTNVSANYNGQSGIYLSSCPNSIIKNVTANYNAIYGIYLYGQYSNLTNVTANYNSGSGIYLYFSQYSIVTNATTNYNSQNGLYFDTTPSTKIDNLTSSFNSGSGIFFFSLSQNNIITNSRIERNNNYGIYLSASLPNFPRYNKLYNNFLNNSVNLGSNNDSNLNYWNTTFSCFAGPNIVGGVPIAGNYWATPSGTGFSNTCIDTNSKGICDSSYTPVTNNVDYLPLHMPGPDTTPPTIIFVSPTPPNNTKVSGDYIQVNISIPTTPNSCLEEIPNACILNWYNGFVWANYTMTKSGMSCYLNMTGLLPNIVYQYRVYANDYAGNMNVSETRQNEVLDTLPPYLMFVLPTPNYDAVVPSNYIEVNVTLSEPAGTCLLNWFDGSWANYTMAVAPGGLSCYFNMTDLSNGMYMFKVYANDTAGNMGVSETRQNRVTYIGPVITLAKFSAGMVYLEMGKNGILKVYVNNPDLQFANISIWLGGDYPAALTKFSAYPGVYYTADMRNATVGLNPKEQRVLDLIMYSTGPGEYIINVTATTTASGKKDFDSIKLFIGYPPSFPGLELWGILLILAVSGLAYWKIKK